MQGQRSPSRIRQRMCRLTAFAPGAQAAPPWQHSKRQGAPASRQQHASGPVGSLLCRPLPSEYPPDCRYATLLQIRCGGALYSVHVACKGFR